MVIGIENVDVFVKFLVEVKNEQKKSAIRKKYDHIETLKLWQICSKDLSTYKNSELHIKYKLFR
jgi:hypothetical protein